MIKQILLVALGGGLGSIARYFTALGVSKHFLQPFPLGTFLVNVIGCFIIGLLIALASRYSLFDSELRLLLITGFCGGFTTFSTFSSESLGLLETGNYFTFSWYVVGSIVLGLVAVWLGSITAKILI